MCKSRDIVCINGVVGAAIVVTVAVADVAEANVFDGFVIVFLYFHFIS